MALAAASLLALLLGSAELPGHRHEARADLGDGIHKIRHVVIIMQENRSFDSYFGTYPRADGIPGLAGNPGRVPCVPDPARHRCQRPYLDGSPRNAGGPHSHGNALDDINGGVMNGFIRQAERGRTAFCRRHIDDPRCSLMPKRPDVMGYHDGREIPNYWDYASHFVLQDHMFESDSSWSLPEHLYLVSGWSAKCASKKRPDELPHRGEEPRPAPEPPATRPASRPTTPGRISPTSSTSTESAGATTSSKGTQPDCSDDAMFCAPVPQNSRRPASGTRCPGSTRCDKTTSLRNIAALRDFFNALQTTPSRRSRGSCRPTRTASIRRALITAARRT